MHTAAAALYAGGCTTHILAEEAHGVAQLSQPLLHLLGVRGHNHAAGTSLRLNLPQPKENEETVSPCADQELRACAGLLREA